MAGIIDTRVLTVHDPDELPFTLGPAPITDLLPEDQAAMATAIVKRVSRRGSSGDDASGSVRKDDLLLAVGTVPATGAMEEVEEMVKSAVADGTPLVFGRVRGDVALGECLI